MGKSLVDRDELKKAAHDFRAADAMLINQNDCVVSKLIEVHTRLQGSDEWSGPACEVFTDKLGREIQKLIELDKTIKSLISYCGKVDGDVEMYIRYVQSLLGRKF